MVELNIHTDIRSQRGQYWLENIMKDRLAVSMFGQKRLSREGGIEIVVKELCTRMVRDGCQVTCYNRSGHHVSGAEYDNKIEYDGIRQKFVPTIERNGLAAVSSSFFAALYSAFGKYDVVHIHAEGPAFFSWLPKILGKRVVVTIHGECEIIRGCHNRDKGTAENERLRDLKFIFSYPKNERLIFLGGRNAAQEEISTMRVG
jgi:glycosyltransferase involved in cell wall biosynthesis